MMPDVLFKGVPNQYVRGYVAEAIERTRPGVVVIPCTGAFALAQAAIAGGARPAQIVTGDITLYSSAVGGYLNGQGVPGLRALGEWSWLNERMTTPLDQLAAVTVALRTLQYLRPKSTAHYRQREAELRRRADYYIALAKSEAERTVGNLSGLRYDARDLWETVHEFVWSPDALLLLDPPWYRQGYTKMFRGVDEAFVWEAPPVPEFDPVDAGRLLTTLAAGASRSLVLFGTPTRELKNPETTFGEPWRAMYVHRPSVSMNAVATWVLANKTEGLREVVQRQDMKPSPAPKYKLFEGILTSQTRLWQKNEAQDVVGYYRDLLVHRLPLINTELYQVLLADGQLLGCLGFHVANLRTSGGGKDAVANLTFAFNPQVPAHPKLNKLLMMCACSSWWWAPYMTAIEHLPKKIQTTMLTPYPEAKIARGVMRMTNRERFKGQWKLTYYADVVTRTMEQTRDEWLRRWGEPVTTEPEDAQTMAHSGDGVIHA